MLTRISDRGRWLRFTVIRSFGAIAAGLVLVGVAMLVAAGMASISSTWTPWALLIGTPFVLMGVPMMYASVDSVAIDREHLRVVAAKRAHDLGGSAAVLTTADLRVVKNRQGTATIREYHVAIVARTPALASAPTLAAMREQPRTSILVTRSAATAWWIAERIASAAQIRLVDLSGDVPVMREADELAMPLRERMLRHEETPITVVTPPASVTERTSEGTLDLAWSGRRSGTTLIVAYSLGLALFFFALSVAFGPHDGGDARVAAIVLAMPGFATVPFLRGQGKNRLLLDSRQFRHRSLIPWPRDTTVLAAHIEDIRVVDGPEPMLAVFTDRTMIQMSGEASDLKWIRSKLVAWIYEHVDARAALPPQS